MKVEIEDFKTGWHGISIGLNSKQIDGMINMLNKLKENQDHFHFRSNFKGKGGVGDIEFYFLNNTDEDNMHLE